MRFHRWIFPLALLTLAGCNQAEPPANVAPPVGKQEPVKTGDITLSEEEVANIKKLPDAADQQLALDQKICAVLEEDGKPSHLGSMGKPIKKVVKDKTVFVCCPGCGKDLEKDPEKYLARVGK